MARVMIVDDDADIRELVKATLQAAGHEVVGEAADGRDAIRQVTTVQPDIVLLDVMMPGLSGLDALVLLRREAPTVRVVMLTALSCDDVAPVALGRGARGCVEKLKMARDLPRVLGAVA